MKNMTAPVPPGQPRPSVAPVWTLHAKDVLSGFETRRSGLDEPEVARRVQSVGPNQLPEKPPRSSWALLVSQFKGFLNLLLLVAAVIAWAIGDIKDALMIGAVTVFNAILGFAQEHRAERALLALKRMVAFRARVRRDDLVREVGADELVPGDIVFLEAGDRVPGRRPAPHRFISRGRRVSAHW